MTGKTENLHFWRFKALECMNQLIYLLLNLVFIPRLQIAFGFGQRNFWFSVLFLHTPDLDDWVVNKLEV